MDLTDIKTQIQESIDRQIDEISKLKRQPPRSFLAYKLQVSEALTSIRAPRPLVEAVFEARGSYHDVLWTNWRDVEAELAPTSSSETVGTWQEIKNYYVRDVANAILREFTEGTRDNPLLDD